MILRIARIVLIAVGLIVLGYGVVEGFQHDGDDNGIGATWDCHPIGDGPQTRCLAAYENTGDTHVGALCLAGVGLICTSMAIGLLEPRTRGVAPHQGFTGPNGPHRQQVPLGAPAPQEPRHQQGPWNH